MDHLSGIGAAQFAAMDEMLLSAGRSSDKSYGFSQMKDKGLIESLVSAGWAEIRSSDGKWTRLALVPAGIGALLEELARRLPSGEKPGPRGTDYRLAVAVGLAQPDGSGQGGYDTRLWIDGQTGETVPAGQAVPYLTDDNSEVLCRSVGMSVPEAGSRRRDRLDYAALALSLAARQIAHGSAGDIGARIREASIATGLMPHISPATRLVA